MILAIVERWENLKGEEPFHQRYYLTQFFKDIFEKLDILLFPIMSSQKIEEIGSFCDGLIVTGSAIDILPEYYSEKNLQKGNFEVDEYQEVSKMIAHFAKQQKPILGICGGMQDINVYFGGSLNQFVENHDLKGGRHAVKIEENSFLYDVYQTKEISTNSFHHQVVKKVAQGFAVTAVSEDGVIEAIEKDNIIAVQWHPEEMGDMAFFERFVEKYFDRKIGGNRCLRNLKSIFGILNLINWISNSIEDILLRDCIAMGT